MCESSKSTACYTFIFTCNHFLPSTTQNPPLPSSSLSKYGLIQSYYLTHLPFGLTPLVSFSHRHTHIPTTAFYCSYCHTHTYTNTLRHSNQIRQSLVFLNTAAKVRYGYSVSSQPGSISAYQPNCSHVSPKQELSALLNVTDIMVAVVFSVSVCGGVLCRENMLNDSHYCFRPSYMSESLIPSHLPALKLQASM